MMRSFKRVTGRGKKLSGDNHGGCGANSLGGTRMRGETRSQRDASSQRSRPTSPRKK